MYVSISVCISKKLAPRVRYFFCTIPGNFKYQTGLNWTIVSLRQEAVGSSIYQKLEQKYFCSVLRDCWAIAAIHQGTICLIRSHITDQRPEGPDQHLSINSLNQTRLSRHLFHCHLCDISMHKLAAILRIQEMHMKTLCLKFMPPFN